MQTTLSENPGVSKTRRHPLWHRVTRELGKKVRVSRRNGCFEYHMLAVAPRMHNGSFRDRIDTAPSENNHTTCGQTAAGIPVGENLPFVDGSDMGPLDVDSLLSLPDHGTARKERRAWNQGLRKQKELKAQAQRVAAARQTSLVDSRRRLKLFRERQVNCLQQLPSVVAAEKSVPESKAFVATPSSTTSISSTEIMVGLLRIRVHFL